MLQSFAMRGCVQTPAEQTSLVHTSLSDAHAMLPGMGTHAVPLHIWQAGHPFWQRPITQGPFMQVPQLPHPLTGPHSTPAQSGTTAGWTHAPSRQMSCVQASLSDVQESPFVTGTHRSPLWNWHGGHGWHAPSTQAALVQPGAQLKQPLGDMPQTLVPQSRARASWRHVPAWQTSVVQRLPSSVQGEPFASGAQRVPSHP